MNQKIKLTFLALFFTLFQLGCDPTGGTPTTTTLTYNTSFDFEFNSTGRNPNIAETLTSTNSIDLSSFLATSGGFTSADVVKVSAETVEIEVVFPSTETVSFLKNVQFKATKLGGSTVSMASLDPVPTSSLDTVSIPIISGHDITTVAKTGSFNGQLGFVANTYQTARPYELKVRTKLLIQVNV